MGSFRRLLQGSAIVFLGLALGKGGSLLSKLIVARLFGDQVFGAVSIGITVVTLISTVTLIGLDTGISRMLPRSDVDSNQAIGTGLKVVIVLSLTGATITYSFSSQIATYVFFDQRLANVVQLFGLTIPAVVLMKYTIGVVRGQQKTVPKVVIRDIGLPASRLLFLAIILSVWGTQYRFDATWAFAMAYLASGALALLYILRTNSIPTLLSSNLDFNLVRFSMPLMITTGLGFLFEDLDILFIGRYLMTENVGHYSAAYTLAMTLTIILHAIAFLFVPMISEMHSKQKSDEIRQLYLSSTEINYVLITPLFLVMFLFPEDVLVLLFGDEYHIASVTLSILSIGFYFHTLVGHNRGTLVSIGYPKQILYGMAFGVGFNAMLNFYLVNLMGILGAAIATTVSYLCLNIMYSGYLYYRHSILPFSRTVLLAAPLPLAAGLPAVVTKDVQLSLIFGIISVGTHLLVSLYLFDFTEMVQEVT